MKISLAKLVLVPAVAMVFLTSGQKAQAVANNNPPPAGNVILDLAGQAVPHGAYQQYTTTFTASMALTEFSIAQREDPAYIYLDDVSVNHAVPEPVTAALSLLSLGGLGLATLRRRRA